MQFLIMTARYHSTNIFKKEVSKQNQYILSRMEIKNVNIKFTIKLLSESLGNRMELLNRILADAVHITETTSLIVRHPVNKNG